MDPPVSLSQSRTSSAFRIPGIVLLSVQALVSECPREGPLKFRNRAQPSSGFRSPPRGGGGGGGILKDAKTILVLSKTAFLTVDTLDRALARETNWPKLGLTIVQDKRVADLLIEIDRPLFTYIHTFVIVDKRTSIVLGSGKVTALDGTIASTGLADDIVAIFSAVRIPKLQP